MKRLARVLRALADRIDAPPVVTYRVEAQITPEMTNKIRQAIREAIRREGGQAAI